MKFDYIQINHQVIGGMSLHIKYINSSLEFEYLEKQDVKTFAETMINQNPKIARTKWISIGDSSGTSNPVGYLNGFITQRYRDAYISLFHRDGTIFIAHYTNDLWSEWKHLSPTS